MSGFANKAKIWCCSLKRWPLTSNHCCEIEIFWLYMSNKFDVLLNFNIFQYNLLLIGYVCNFFICHNFTIKSFFRVFIKELDEKSSSHDIHLSSDERKVPYKLKRLCQKWCVAKLVILGSCSHVYKIFNIFEKIK